jgi:hypothetical protein
METILLKVNHSFSARIHHICVADIPLFGNCPVEHGSSAGELMLLQWYELFYHRERFANSVTRDASTYGVQVSYQVEKFLTNVGPFTKAQKLVKFYRFSFETSFRRRHPAKKIKTRRSEIIHALTRKGRCFQFLTSWNWTDVLVSAVEKPTTTLETNKANV